MKIQSTENFLWKAKVVGYLLAPIVIIFALSKACNRADKQYSAKCHKEKPMFFEGVITNYKTDILAEKSTFNLNDTISITIPRNSKEMYLNDHDTIIKIKDTNLYIVKRSTLWWDKRERQLTLLNLIVLL